MLYKTEKINNFFNALFAVNTLTKISFLEVDIVLVKVNQSKYIKTSKAAC